LIFLATSARDRPTTLHPGNDGQRECQRPGSIIAIVIAIFIAISFLLSASRGFPKSQLGNQVR
jgi:hypothetical protein